jgi:hypothetical protein
MPWLRLGTVSVTLNSSTVTGVGTGFAANSRVGDAFIGPDGRQYELANVASDTVISILPAYLGATVTGASYAIAPMQGYPKALADDVRSWVNTYGPKMAALGTTGNYDILPVTKGGTGGADQAGARAGLGLGAVAVESIVPVTKGGTGGNTQASARTGLGLGSAAVAPIVGTVSQSGGVPTGAIQETGSNANGTYVKYADGTMICRGISPNSVACNTAGGAVFHSPAVAFTFPAAFVGSVPCISAGPLTTTNFYSWVAMEGGASANLVSTALRLVSPSSGATGYICYTAIGRWF